MEIPVKSASVTRASRKLIVLPAVVAAVSVLLVQSSLRATTNTITVNTVTDDSGSDDGLCSVRKAINNANSKSDTTGGDCVAGIGTDTIVFNLSGTITLGSTLPTVANTLTIDGTGQAITIDGANLYQVGGVSGGATLNLIQLTLADGNNCGPVLPGRWRRGRH